MISMDFLFGVFIGVLIGIFIIGMLTASKDQR